MAKDRLFLIKPGFTNPARPGTEFVCPSCNQVEGLLASFPERGNEIEVIRVEFPRPRHDVIALIGEENQGLPVLILGDNPPDDAQDYNGVRFVNDTPRILALLAERHGFPKLH